jgi:hypothetical protein
MLRDNLYYNDPFLCLADFAHSDSQKKWMLLEKALGQDGDPQYRPGKVFERSRHPRIRARHLEPESVNV